MLKSFFTVSFVLFFATVSGLLHAGLEIDNKWGEIVALYPFDDARDNGPRGFDGRLNEEAVIGKGGRGHCLKLTGTGYFVHCCNDQGLALLNEFSIVVWVKLNPQTDHLDIGMHGFTEDGDTAGWALLRIYPDGNVTGNYTATATDRSIAKTVSLWTLDKNVSDNKWHHIAFTSYDGIYNIFIDGELAVRKYVDEYISFFSDSTSTYVENLNPQGEFKGRVLVDEFGLFETGLSLYEVRAIRQSGFDAFLQAMPVEPTGKMATMWGDIKMR